MEEMGTGVSLGTSKWPSQACGRMKQRGEGREGPGLKWHLVGFTSERKPHAW